MDSKTRIIATLAGFVTTFLLGWLFYGVLLVDFYAANTGSAMNVMRSDSEMIWWALIIGNVLQAYLLVYIFSKWTTISSFGAGLQAGLTLGLILGLSFSLNMYATTNMMNITGALADCVVATVMTGLTGGVVGMVLGRK